MRDADFQRLRASFWCLKTRKPHFPQGKSCGNCKNCWFVRAVAPRSSRTLIPALRIRSIDAVLVRAQWLDSISASDLSVWVRRPSAFLERERERLRRAAARIRRQKRAENRERYWRLLIEHKELHPNAVDAGANSAFSIGSQFLEAWAQAHSFPRKAAWRHAARSLAREMRRDYWPHWGLKSEKHARVRISHSKPPPLRLPAVTKLLASRADRKLTTSVLVDCEAAIREEFAAAAVDGLEFQVVAILSFIRSLEEQWVYAWVRRRKVSDLGKDLTPRNRFAGLFALEERKLDQHGIRNRNR